jgi:hypothetical protein
MDQKIDHINQNNQIKKMGGKRPGAGRKVGAKTLILKDMSAEILAAANPRAIWTRLLESKDERIVLEAAKYLSNRIHGMPTQAISGDSDGSPIIIQFAGVSHTIQWLGGIVDAIQTSNQQDN